ncbi:hypothetical protein PUNSTDRAFT_36816, partial [Punctularia strigosozonata HHB-11173 SS5]
FNDAPPADVILQSCDSVQFFVCKVILSFASPFFRDMFTLPQSSGSSDVQPDIPVIPMVESSATLDDLL